MPNKFSHGVVLARYSSLGLINLPNSEHVAHLNPYPQSSRTPSSTFKAPSNPNRLSLAGDADENRRQTFVPRQISEASPLADPSGSRQMPGRRIIIDTDVRSENVPDPSHADSHEGVSSISTCQANQRSFQRNGQNLDIESMNLSSLDSREAVIEGRTSRAIHAETSLSSETFAAIERPPHTSQPARNGAIVADSVSGRRKDPSKSSSRSVQQTPPTQASQPTKSPRMRKPSPIDSAIAASTPPEKSSRPRKLDRNALAYRTEAVIFNPLPEAAHFDGFSDPDEPDEICQINIVMPGSISKARSSFTSTWPSDTEVASPRNQSNCRRQRSPSLDLAGHHPTMLQPTPPPDHELSSHKSLNSSSSLSSLEMPIVERAHPLRANKGAAMQSTDASHIPSYLATSNDKPDIGPDPSPLKRSSSSRGESEAEYLEEFRRDLTLRLLGDKYQDREADAGPLVRVGDDFPPETTIYPFQNTIGRSRAQAEMMLPKTEEPTSKDKCAKKDVGLSNEDTIKHAERGCWKATKASGGEPARASNDANAKSKMKEGVRFFQRLRSQK